MSDLHLGEFEQLVLLALLHLKEHAYGVSIRQEIESRTGRSVSLGAVYKTLERLEDKGCVRSALGDPTPERGGRRKKFYRASPLGVRALGESFQALRRMAEGVEGF